MDPHFWVLFDALAAFTTGVGGVALYYTIQKFRNYLATPKVVYEEEPDKTPAQRYRESVASLGRSVECFKGVTEWMDSLYKKTRSSLFFPLSERQAYCAEQIQLAHEILKECLGSPATFTPDKQEQVGNILTGLTIALAELTLEISKLETKLFPVEDEQLQAETHHPPIHPHLRAIPHHSADEHLLHQYH